MKKFLKWFSIVILVLIIFLIAAPFLFKDKIIARIKEETNKNLNAKVDFRDLSLSLIRNFPNVSAGLEDLSVINVKPFEGDTLICAKNFRLVLDLMSVISGDQMIIRSVDIESPVMKFLVNKDGVANWDIAKKDESKPEPQTASSFKASLKHYGLSNGLVIYNDKTMPFLLRLEGVEHNGSGDFAQDLFTLSTKTGVKKADMEYGGVRYIAKAVADITADLEMDMKNMKFTFKDNKIALNDLDLGVNGWVAMPDTNIDMDLKFSAAKTDFKNFISMVPAVYSENFKDVRSSGKMGLTGFIKGRYNAGSMPGFGVNLDIDNGMFQYPSLPSSLKNVFVNLKINNLDGVPDHTFINLSRFHMEMNGDPFDARLVLKTPVSDPDIDAFMKGKIDLSGISKLVPLEKGTNLNGIITADLTAKGRMSSIEQKRYEQFNASGNFGIANMNYSSAEMKTPVNIQTMALSFNPQRVALSSFIAKMGKSDFNANGTIDNLLAYMLKNELLRGAFNVNSSKIDLNEFMGGETASSTSKDTTALAVLDIPQNIDFQLNAAVGQLFYQNLTINNLKGKIQVKDKAIRMQDVAMQMMDGFITMNGGYNSADLKNPAFDFALRIKDFDIQRTASSFESVSKLAPITKNCNGKFSADMTVNGSLDQTMSPVMNSLNGGGKLMTSTITVNNFPVFVKIADVLKMSQWKNMTVPPVNPSFKFTNGRVYVDPFDMNVNGIKSTVAGSNGFDQTIDYTIASQIPRAAFGGAANNVLNSMVSSANAKGANFSVGDVVPVNIKVGGTVNDPKIGTDLNTAGAKVMDDLKAKAREEFDKQKAEAEARARAEADKLKNEAQAKLDAEKAKATAEAERIKKEAEARAKAVADSLKKAAENQAKKGLKNLLKK